MALKVSNQAVVERSPLKHISYRDRQRSWIYSRQNHQKKSNVDLDQAWGENTLK
jgi:hypothetical protein